LLAAAAFVVVVAGLKAAQNLLVPFLGSVFLAILAAPAVVWLRRRRVPTLVAVLLVVLAMMAVLTGIGAMVGGSIRSFTEAVPRYDARFRVLGEGLRSWLAARGVSFGAGSFADVLDPGALLKFLGGTLGGLVAAASNTVLVLLTTVFILFELTGFPTKLRVAMGSESADLSRFERVTVEVQRYLLIKTSLSLATGLLAGFWCAVLGVDFALLWGLVAFLLNYIPNLGSIIAAVPPILLALVQLGPGRAVAVAAGYVAINTIIGNVIEPQVMGRRLGLSPLVVFLSLVFWGWVWGPVGMLLSVPLTMMVKIMLESSPRTWRAAVLLDTTAGAESILGRLRDGAPGPARPVPRAPDGREGEGTPEG
jgi:predicted PurR-regulated permease PerM